MREEILGFFRENKIEYFGAVPYADLYEISPEIIKREDITPKSVIVFLLPYFVSRPENISVYAASLDYHIILRKVTDGLISLLSELYPENRFVGYGDHSPIDEVSAALKCGLGLRGDSGLFINEKYGSYVFIGDVVTDISPDKLRAISLPIRECIHCKRCINACPTGILRGESSECLSAITQKKGELSEDEIALMKRCNTVWGCDFCQSTCPYNENAQKTPIEFFYTDRIECLTSDILSSLDKKTLRARAFGWRGRSVVERNLKALKY